MIINSSKKTNIISNISPVVTAINFLSNSTLNPNCYYSAFYNSSY